MKHGGTVFSVSSDYTGERIVSGCRDGIIRVIRVPTGLIERTIEINSPIYGVAFELAGTRFAVAAKEVLRIVDAESGEIQHTFQIGSVVHSTTFDTSGLLIAAGVLAPAAKLVDSRSRAAVRRLDILRDHLRVFRLPKWNSEHYGTNPKRG